MSQLDRIKAERKAHKEHIAMRDALRRLEKNKDFIKVIDKHFMDEECARYARISGLVSTHSDMERADALAKAQAAGHLAEFFSALIIKGNAAERSLEQLNEEEAYLLSENVGEDE